MLPLALPTALPLLGFAATPPLIMALTLFGLCGLGTAYALGLQQPFRDAIPVAHRGQAFGLKSTGVMGGQGLTPPLAGAIATATGVSAAMAICGALCLITVLVLRRTLQDTTTRNDDSIS